MFESTLPFGEPELMRVSAFQRYLDDLVKQGNVSDASASRLSALSPSLLQDLMRFEHDGRQTELLEAVAACVRHARPLCIHLQCDDKVVPLTLFPMERLAHCPVPMAEFLACKLAELQVMHVEPAMLRPPGDPVKSLVGELHLYHPLAPVTWQLAMHGSREELLPEIAGSAAYRVAPGVDLSPLALGGSLLAAVKRLQRHTTNLREISDWPGFTRGRATRLLNALYLQAGLIVSRTHPAATNEGWF
ncbi:hypothetical protein [Ideonella sp. BN130291]|uniref:hypothetical protein n=1 Tax=Ideonella sp. BN130291 TaxID=3112940 RepID=UPI002E2759C8|nr:hypothetical protein [Ideonella sp. BN130291]